MGFAFSPSYACLVMGWSEKEVAWSLKNNRFVQKIIRWIRFIDDLLIIWNGSDVEFQEYFEFLNSVSSLKFTFEMSKERVVFLDTEIYIKDNQIQTMLHRKVTSTNATLQATSFHQPSLITSIPYGEFLQIRRICSEENEWLKHSAKTRERFKCRKYNKSTIERCWKRANEKCRDECLTPRSKEKTSESEPIRFITDFSQQSKEISNILKKNWKILQLDNTIGKLMGKHPIITYRRAKNVKDQLVHSHFKGKKGTDSWLQTKGFVKCHNCKVCQITKPTTEVHMANNKMWKIQELITCKSQYTIYLIECPCPLKYVGSTICELKKRVLENVRAKTNKDRNNSVAKHMELHHNGDWKTLKFFGLETVPPNPRGGNRGKILRQKESRHILKMRMMMPYGLNQSEELYIHL